MSVRIAKQAPDWRDGMVAGVGEYQRLEFFRMIGRKSDGSPYRFPFLAAQMTLASTRLFVIGPATIRFGLGAAAVAILIAGLPAVRMATMCHCGRYQKNDRK